MKIMLNRRWLKKCFFLLKKNYFRLFTRQKMRLKIQKLLGFKMTLSNFSVMCEYNCCLAISNAHKNIFSNNNFLIKGMKHITCCIVLDVRGDGILNV